MRTLLLLRHAKSSWDRPSLDDEERPLAPRGRRAAPSIARHLVEHGWTPDLVLCSHAVRVRQTWELVAPILGKEIPVKTLRTLYLGSPSRLLETLQRTDDAAATVMMIGHNPGLGRLAVALSGSGPADALQKMQAKFPTAGLAVIRFAVDHWADVGTGQGALAAFVRPKDLD